MATISEEKAVKEATPNNEDLDYKIEIATQTLERNIGFVANCDN